MSYPLYGNVIIDSSNGGSLGGTLTISNSCNTSTLNNQASIAFALADTSYGTLNQGLFRSGTDFADVRITALIDNISPTIGTGLSISVSSNHSQQPVEALRIRSNGNIGIGTTNPQFLLDISGQVRANNLPCSFSLGHNSENAVWVKVGVFTADQVGRNCIIKLYANRGYNADLAQSSITTIFFKTSNGSSTYGTTGFAGDSYHYVEGGSVPFVSAPIWIANAAGTSATNYTLYLNLGAYNSSTFYTAEVSQISTCFWTPTYQFNSTPPQTTASSSCFVSVSQYLLTGGRVGIGTTNPLYALDVSGDARVGTGVVINSVATLEYSGSFTLSQYAQTYLLIPTTTTVTATITVPLNFFPGGSIINFRKSTRNSSNSIGIAFTSRTYVPFNSVTSGSLLLTTSQYTTAILITPNGDGLQLGVD